MQKPLQNHAPRHRLQTRSVVVAAVKDKDKDRPEGCLRAVLGLAGKRKILVLPVLGGLVRGPEGRKFG